MCEGFEINNTRREQKGGTSTYVGELRINIAYSIGFLMFELLVKQV